MSETARYIPAFRFRVLTPLFDPMARWVMRELTFKRRLIDEARIRPGFRVLDVGSGTGTLTVLTKTLHSDAKVAGVDGDANVLAIARTKAVRESAEIGLGQGLAGQLPYPAGLFDRVLSSLVFHHLTTEDKRRALAEIVRVLKPGGELLIVDFGRPQTMLARAISEILRRVEPTDDLIHGLLPGSMEQAGFVQVQVVVQFMTVFGTLSLYRGRKPG